MAKSRRRRRMGAIAAVVIVIVALVIVKQYVLNDDIHRVGRDEAVQDYRERATTSAPDTAGGPTTTAGSLAVAEIAPQTLPAPGVYVYATMGEESIDALGGTSHTYPVETTITVVPDGCGVLLRWDVLQERREQWRLCLGDDGIRLPTDGAQSYHVFYGQSKVEDLTCDREVVVVPLDGERRDPVALTCLLGDLAWQPVWRVMEQGTRLIGGAEVPVLHVRMTITDDDQYYEHITLDWYLDVHGLPVAAKLTKRSLSDTVAGDVVYTEQYAYELQSLTPLR